MHNSKNFFDVFKNSEIIAAVPVDTGRKLNVQFTSCVYEGIPKTNQSIPLTQNEIQVA